MRNWRALCVVGLAMVMAIRLATVDGVGKTHDTANEPGGENLVFKGNEFGMHAGWTQASPGCGSPQPNTVVVGFWGGSCPAMQPPATPLTAVRTYPMSARQTMNGG